MEKPKAPRPETAAEPSAAPLLSLPEYLRQAADYLARQMAGAADVGERRRLRRLLLSAEYWSRVYSWPIDPSANNPSYRPAAQAGPPQRIIHPQRYRVQDACPHRQFTAEAARECRPACDHRPLTATRDGGRTWQPAPEADAVRPDPQTLFQGADQ